MKQQPAAEEVTENIEVVTPGVLLKEARIALQLAPHEIAKTLNLKAALIEAIEENDFEDMPSITFTRGYLKSYAKLLHVNETEVLEAFEYWSSAEQQQLEMQSFSHRSAQRSKDNWLMIFSFLVLAVLIVSAVAWWFQRNETPDSQVNAPTTSAQPSSNQPSSTQSGTSQPDAADETDDNVAAQTTTPLETENTDTVENKIATDDIATENNPNNELAAAVVDQAVENQNSESQPVADEPTAAQTDDTPPATEQDTEQVNANLTHLELRFSDSCWINIADATGERIAIGTKKKGHVSSVYGVAPFTIKLGKPDAVSIWLDGEQKEIPYYPKGSIANFELAKD